MNSKYPSPEQMLAAFSCIPRLCTACYDSAGRLLSHSGPKADIFDELFLQCGYMERVLSYAKTSSAPYALSIYMGLVWYAVLEKTPISQDLSRIYLLGPVFQYPVSVRQLDQALREYESLGMTFRSRRMLLSAMKELPVIPHTQFASYAILLHCCVSGEKISYQDLNALPDTPPAAKHDFFEPLEPFYTGTPESMTEKNIPFSPATYKTIQHTEEDLLTYLTQGVAPSDDPRIRHMVLLPTDHSGIQSPLGKARISAALLTYLYARSAVQAGLSCELSYRLADEYLGKIDMLHSPMGLQKLMGELSSDYRDRIRALQESPSGYSREIRLCLDYIAGHLSAPIPLKALASLSGYTPYYLSRRFKQETGLSPGAYIRKEKIKYAAHLLITTEDSIQKIAERIGQRSRSRFSEDFSAIMGMPPGVYRKTHRT